MKFKKIYIEITDICHSACSFCPSPFVDKKGDMDFKLYAKILPKIKKYTDTISLHILGDPLCSANLNSFIKEAQGFKIDIVTLGKYLKETQYEALLLSCVHQISFSLSQYCLTPNHFDDKYIENILKFCSFVLQGENKIFINFRIQSDVLKQNTSTLNRVLTRLSEFFKINFDAELSIIKNNFSNDKYDKNTKIRLAPRVFLNFKQSFNWKESSNIKIQNKYCYGLIHQLGILSDGRVVPCCIDYGGAIELGNLWHCSLEDILDSSRARRIRDGFLRGVAHEEYCQKCQYRIGMS